MEAACERFHLCCQGNRIFNNNAAQLIRLPFHSMFETYRYSYVMHHGT
jgi:hypothetical protein